MKEVIQAYSPFLCLFLLEDITMQDCVAKLILILALSQEIVNSISDDRLI